MNISPLNIPEAMKEIREAILSLPRLRKAFRHTFRRRLSISTKDKNNENFWNVAIKDPEIPILNIRCKLLVTNNTDDVCYIKNLRLKQYNSYLDTDCLVSNIPPSLNNETSAREVYSDDAPIPPHESRHVQIMFLIEDIPAFHYDSGLYIIVNNPTLDNLPMNLKRGYLLLQRAKDQIPEAMYFIDRYTGIPKIVKLDFLHSKNLSALLNALYPAVNNHCYQDIPSLSLEHKKTIALFTGHPFIENPIAPLHLDLILTDHFGMNFKKKNILFYSVEQHM